MRSFEEQQVYTVINTAPIRAEIERQTEEFLARGGKIKILEREESKATTTDPDKFTNTDLSKLVSQIKDPRLGQDDKYVFQKLKEKLSWSEDYLKARLKSMNRELKEIYRNRYFEEGRNLPPKNV